MLDLLFEAKFYPLSNRPRPLKLRMPYNEPVRIMRGLKAERVEEMGRKSSITQGCIVDTHLQESIQSSA